MLHIAKPVLTVHDACLAYGDVQALNGLSLELHAGELLGLLGPNGAGKTTLIQCLSQRRALDEGTIHVNIAGRLADCVGIVPQEIALYPDLTVHQNLRAFGRLHGLTGMELRRRVGEALRWANLAERAGALASALSGGMQRRLNIACGVLHRPPILLLDEPTVGVDPQSRERIYGMLDTLLDEGTSILMTTHHLDEAQLRCDRIAIVDAGRVLDTGTFDELLRRTIGTAQQVSVRFATPVSHVPSPLQLNPAGLEAVGFLDEVSSALPDLLLALQTVDAKVEHLTLREPTLQYMFLHLTGKELRE